MFLNSTAVVKPIQTILHPYSDVELFTLKLRPRLDVVYCVNTSNFRNIMTIVYQTVPEITVTVVTV